MPTITDEEKQISLRSLVELLRLKVIPMGLNAKRNGITIPLILKDKGTSEKWIDVYHPMTSPDLIKSQANDFAKTRSIPCVLIDSFSLIHDLPAAFKRATDS